MRHVEKREVIERDNRAIEALRRPLEREIGSPWREPEGDGAIARVDRRTAAAIHPTALGRSGTRRRVGRGAGAVTLAAVVIGALVSFAVLIGPSPRRAAELPRRDVPVAERATIREISLREPRGNGHRAGRADPDPPGGGGIEAPGRRGGTSLVTRYRAGSRVGPLPARSAPLTSIQAP